MNLEKKRNINEDFLDQNLETKSNNNNQWTQDRKMALTKWSVSNVPRYAAHVIQKNNKW